MQSKQTAILNAKSLDEVRAIAAAPATDSSDAVQSTTAAAPTDLETELLQALQWILPLAEGYLKKAPTHPDNAKLESAREAIRKASGK